MAEKKAEIRKCFVVCPIGADGSSTRTHADWLLDEIIQPVFDRDYQGKFSILRSDRIDTPGMIDAQIINHLIDDDLVIADMTDLNANAFYELGIRHMAQRPVVHMFKMGQEIPFDVKLFRAVPFDYCNAAALRNARDGLARALADALNDSHAVDNPVTRARGQQKIELSTMPEIQMLQRRIDEMQEKLQSFGNNSPMHRFQKESIKHSIGDESIISIQNEKNIIITFDHILTKNEISNYIRSIDAISSKSDVVSNSVGAENVIITNAIGKTSRIFALGSTIEKLPNVINVNIE